MSEPFPPPFRDCLRQILRRAPRVRTPAQQRDPGRRRVLARSGTFAGHRAYAPGDDLRYVDWNVYARTGDLFLKVLEEDDRPTLTLCLDRSASMQTGDPMRYQGALRLAAILGGLALVQLEGLMLVGGRSGYRSLSGAGSLDTLLQALRDMPITPGDPAEVLRAPVEQGWPGAVVWISDFADPEAAMPALHLLRRHGKRVTGWLPEVPEDRAPLLEGSVLLQDPETGEQHELEIDAALRAAMAEELRLLERQQAAAFASVGYPLVRFALPSEGDFRLSSWFTGPWTYRV